MQAAEPASRLRRRLGVADAVVVGLGAMLGTGVFVVFAPAADRAGPWLLVGLLIAASVAYANATSSAQLAARHPESGGTYVFGRARLGPTWGALAGYAFVVGKIASSGAAALAVGAYAWPDQQRAVAALAVVTVTAINLLGIERTVRVTWLLVGALLGVLAVIVAVGLTGSTAPDAEVRSGASVTGILGSAALLFFAFAGYARIATMGEEVRNPARTIPRAIPIALGIVLTIYCLVALAALRTLGEERLATSLAPLADVVTIAGVGGLAWLVRVGGTLAAGAVLLSLVAGISRTMFAMATGGDLPPALAAVHGRFRVPHRAEVLVGIAVLMVVLTGGIVGAVAASAFSVLVYYLITNLSALRLGPGERRWPRSLAWFGTVGCGALALSLPVATIAVSAAGLLLLLVVRRLVRRR